MVERVHLSCRRLYYHSDFYGAKVCFPGSRSTCSDRKVSASPGSVSVIVVSADGTFSQRNLFLRGHFLA